MQYKLYICWAWALWERYGALWERYGALWERYGALRERYGALRERYGALRERYGELRERYGALRERYGALRERYGAVGFINIDVSSLMKAVWSKLKLIRSEIQNSRNVTFILFFFVLCSDQQTHNYFTNYHTATCFDTIVSSSGIL
jgi:hypothetical protein